MVSPDFRSIPSLEELFGAPQVGSGSEESSAGIWVARSLCQPPISQGERPGDSSLWQEFVHVLALLLTTRYLGPFY